MFSEYGMTNASISSVALPLTATPNKGKKGVTKLLFVYVKEPRLKSLTWRTLGFSEYGLTNASILSLAYPLTATQKGVIKRGKKLTCICVNSNAKTSVISYLRVPEYRMTNGSNRRVALNPFQYSQMG